MSGFTSQCPEEMLHWNMAILATLKTWQSWWQENVSWTRIGHSAQVKKYIHIALDVEVHWPAECFFSSCSKIARRKDCSLSQVSGVFVSTLCKSVWILCARYMWERHFSDLCGSNRCPKATQNVTLIYSAIRCVNATHCKMKAVRFGAADKQKTNA